MDDDPSKVGTRVNGLPVLGTCGDLPWLILKHKVAQVIIAMPIGAGLIIRRIREQCKQVGATVRTMPGLYDIISARVGLQQIREVQIEDLLRREPVETDVWRSAARLRGPAGAGHRRGRLDRLRAVPADRASTSRPLLVLLGPRREQHLRDRAGAAAQARPSSAAYRGRSSPTSATRRRSRRSSHAYRPQVVFHAAAHKHVPLMEAQPGRGGHEQRARHAQRGPRRPNARGVERLRADLHRQGGAAARASWARTKRVAELVVQAAPKRTRPAVRRRALRQRARQPRQRDPAVPRADRARAARSP